MSNEVKKQDLLEKLARMQASGMSAVDIAAASGLSASRVSQIFTGDEFLLACEKINTEQFEQQELLNAGWDAVEVLGVNKVIEVLQQNPDPDFALRAAVMANKASRRGNYRNNPIAQNAGLKAVIVLNNTFVERLRGNTTVVGSVKDENESGNTVSGNKKTSLSKVKKAVDFLAPNDVQDLLAFQPSEEEQLMNKLPSFAELNIAESL